MSTCSRAAVILFDMVHETMHEDGSTPASNMDAARKRVCDKRAVVTAALLAFSVCSALLRGASCSWRPANERFAE